MRYLHFGETKPIDVQDREEACVKRICKYFNWTCGVAPNPLASDYEQIKFKLREYIALGDGHTSLRYLSSSRGEGHSTWLVFDDFLEWLNVVEWFSSNSWLQELDLPNHYLFSIKNPFFGKNLKSIEEVEIFLDLLENSQFPKIAR